MALLDTAHDASRFYDLPNDRKNYEVPVENNTLISRCEDPSFYYDMRGLKILIIFNHYQYKKTKHYKYVPSTRDGTFQDVRSLKRTFQSRGFLVITHNDWKYKDIMKYLTDVCNKDHTQTSCVAIAVMTHGKDAHVCAADQLYPVSDITNLLGNAPSLAGKPKLFFIQACREGHTRPRSQRDELFNVPVSADSLMIFSTYEDYLSYRSGNGSWLMQALCNVINTHHETMDLLKMASLVNGLVATKTCAWGKQMPVTELNLTKFLML